MIREHREKMKKANGPYTTIEVSPLHLMFDTSMTDKDPSLWLKIQMNPAIQGPEHRRQLIDGLRSGFIDYIATDHAPHTEEEKCSAFARMQEDFPHEKTNVALADRTAREKHYDFKRICCEDGMSGAPWLDTYAPVVTWLMMNENFITQEIARVTAYNPGKFVNPFLKHQFADSDIDFGKGFGKIEEGYVLSLIHISEPTRR